MSTTDGPGPFRIVGSGGLAALISHFINHELLHYTLTDWKWWVVLSICIFTIIPLVFMLGNIVDKCSKRG